MGREQVGHQSSGATNNLQAVWGADADNIWVVGDAGTILRWDGSKWHTQSSGTTGDLHSVWGTAGNIWVVGDAGTILRWDGSKWRKQSSGTADDSSACGERPQATCGRLGVPARSCAGTGASGARRAVVRPTTCMRSGGRMAAMSGR